MFRKRRPSGRESVIAGATLDTLQARASRDSGMAALASLVPGANWIDNRKRAIRLIDLERRARFARPLTKIA